MVVVMVVLVVMEVMLVVVVEWFIVLGWDGDDSGEDRRDDGGNSVDVIYSLLPDSHLSTCILREGSNPQPLGI